MSGWNDEPPRGGPMVQVKGFAGPLYPPDAAPGHDPSPRTPLALAMKRTLGRLGAWPWTPNEWDDLYGNRFAHGDGWDHPTHAGMEGVQKWSGDPKIQVTGWLGERTFNFLRSVRVPQGRPHAGDPAMDAVAAQLVNQAWDAANPPTSPTNRQAALELAASQIGFKESPAGSNRQKYGVWYGMDGVPWCAIFATWCDLTTGAAGGSFVRGERYSYVPYIVADARAGRYGLSVTADPIPGDLVCYDWQRNGEYDHVGRFERWEDGRTIFSAVEGNTSVSNDSNGGEVMRRSRNVNGQATVFVRVSE